MSQNGIPLEAQRIRALRELHEVKVWYDRALADFVVATRAVIENGTEEARAKAKKAARLVEDVERQLKEVEAVWQKLNTF